MDAVFDTNIIIDALNGIDEANVEYGRYEHVFISRITWMEVLVGAQEDDAELRDFLPYFCTKSAGFNFFLQTGAVST